MEITHPLSIPRPERSYRTLSAVLGTVIVHLLVIGAFFAIKISGMNRDKEESYQITVEDPKLQELIEEMAAAKALMLQKEAAEAVNRMLEEQNRSNIAVNKSNEKLAKELSTQEYINQIKNEYGIQDPVKMEENAGGDEPVMKETKVQEKPAERKEYAGPTNISYDLLNRHVQNLVVPVYKCEGNGLVKLEIVVDQMGAVISSSVLQIETTDNECLLEAAINAANRTKFNSDISAAARQKGTITYIFVAQ